MKLEIPRTCRYSLDTNCFVTSWQRTYPPDLFQPVWDYLDRLIHEERVIASSLVLLELERKADEIHEWAKDREDGFIDLIEPLQDHVRGIERRFPKLLKAHRNMADPFVIGTAMLTEPHLFVVTEEGRGTGTENRPTIPFVCAALGVECRSFVECLGKRGSRSGSDQHPCRTHLFLAFSMSPFTFRGWQLVRRGAARVVCLRPGRSPFAVGVYDPARDRWHNGRARQALAPRLVPKWSLCSGPTAS